MNLAEQLDIQQIDIDIDVDDATTQIKTLHTNADRYITVATIDRNGKYNQRHFKIEELIGK